MKLQSGFINPLMYYGAHETDGILIGVCKMSPEKVYLEVPCGGTDIGPLYLQKAIVRLQTFLTVLVNYFVYVFLV
jgi:hypothetical protein